MNAKMLIGLKNARPRGKSGTAISLKYTSTKGLSVLHGALPIALTVVSFMTASRLVQAQATTPASEAEQRERYNPIAVISNGTPEEAEIYEQEENLAVLKVKAAESLIKANKLPQAVSMFQEVMADWRFENLVPYTHYVDALLKLGRKQDVLALYRVSYYQIRNTKLGRPQITQNLSERMTFVLLLHETGNYREAYKVFQASRNDEDKDFFETGIHGVPLEIEVNDNNFDTDAIVVAAHLAIAIDSHGEFADDVALSHIDAALRLRPKMACAHYYRAEVLRHSYPWTKDKLVEARAEYELASKYGYGAVWIQAEQALGRNHAHPAQKSGSAGQSSRTATFPGASTTP